MIDEFYWFLKTGRPKRKLNVYQLRNELNKYIKDPVFVLSTGRCGTKWFSDIFQKDRSLAVFHAPVPNLSVQGKYAWELLRDNHRDPSSPEFKLLAEIFIAGREQHLRYTAKAEKRYIETNNYITFFAPVLADIFPDAKFLHIVRNPVGFIRSGIDRSYYLEGNVDDMKRISGSSLPGNELWNSYSQYSKIAWLWNETNTFIETFSKQIAPERFKSFVFNLKEPDPVVEVMDFLNINVSRKTIQAQLGKKKNSQERRISKPYDQWETDDQQHVKSIVSDTADRYHFKIQ